MGKDRYFHMSNVKTITGQGVSSRIPTRQTVGVNEPDLRHSPAVSLSFCDLALTLFTHAKCLNCVWCKHSISPVSATTVVLMVDVSGGVTVRIHQNCELSVYVEKSELWWIFAPH